MIDGPTAAEIVARVARWLGELDADTSTFETRVAQNALGIVERELACWPAAESRALARLEKLTGTTSDFATLEAALVERIRAGMISATDPQLIDHLRRSARDRLAIDQPGYAHGLGEDE